MAGLALVGDPGGLVLSQCVVMVGRRGGWVDQRVVVGVLIGRGMAGVMLLLPSSWGCALSC